MTPPPLDLSVVIVSHKTPDEVCACLASLYQGGGLDGLRSEVVLIDNASGDDTAARVRRAFPAVCVIENENNVGFARANNQGIAQVTGRCALLLNPDTLVPPGTLAACVAFLDDQPQTVGAMSCRVQSPDGLLQGTCSRRLITPWSEICRALLLDRILGCLDWFNREPIIGWDRRDTRPVPCILGAFMLIRRAALDRIGGLDERFFLMYEDVDWCKRAQKAGLTILFWPGAHITHLGGQSWKHDPVTTFAASHASAIQYFRKHHPRTVGLVRAVSRLGMEIKIVLLRLNGFRKPGDEYTRRHLNMALAARRTLEQT